MIYRDGKYSRSNRLFPLLPQMNDLTLGLDKHSSSQGLHDSISVERKGTVPCARIFILSGVVELHGEDQEAKRGKYLTTTWYTPRYINSCRVEVLVGVW